MRFPLSKSCQTTLELLRHVFYIMKHKNYYQAYWKVLFLIFQHTLNEHIIWLFLLEICLLVDLALYLFLKWFITWFVNPKLASHSFCLCLLPSSAYALTQLSSAKFSLISYLSNRPQQSAICYPPPRQIVYKAKMLCRQFGEFFGPECDPIGDF